MFGSAALHQPSSLCSSQMFFPAVVRDQRDHPQHTPCPALPCSDPSAAQESPRIPSFGDRGHRCRPCLFPSRPLGYFC